MKILFINPPFQRLKGIAHIYFPLGLGYLCTAVSSDERVNAMIYNAEVPGFSERLPFHVRYLDMLKLHDKYIDSLHDDNHYVWQEVARVIEDFDPDLVAISVMTAKYGSALEVSRITKSIIKDCKVVWGGPHATIDADRVLKNDVVDAVVRGEGEVTFKNLIDSLFQEDRLQDNLRQINGLSYKTGSRIFHNSDRMLVGDLDTLGLPEKDRLFFKERYLPSAWGDLITLRGCSFNCGYCGAHNTWDYKVRYRSPAKICEEIDVITAKYNTRELYFWDDNFTLNKERVFKLCNLLKHTKTRISWGCTTRVDLLDSLLIKAMKDSGCSRISIGVETGSERILKKIHKGITLDKVNSAVELLNKHNLSYEAFFMIGFPEETKDDIEQTFSLMKRLKNASVCFSIFTPYPGTEQYEVAKKHHLMPDNPDWSRFSHQSNDNHFMKYVDREQFNKYVENISSWVDKNNTYNVGLFRLSWNACINFSTLIRSPWLLKNKIHTLVSIINHKIAIILKASQGIELHD